MQRVAPPPQPAMNRRRNARITDQRDGKLRSVGASVATSSLPVGSLTTFIGTAPSVYPSGSAFPTAVMPIWCPAPGLFSITNA